MKRKVQISLNLILCGFTFLLLGCNKEKNLTAVPIISFDNHRQQKLDNGADSVVFTIGFQDGDGDIGFEQGDTFPPFDNSSVYYNDIYINYYELKQGKWSKVKPALSNIDTIRFAYRLPVLNESPKARTIKGQVEVGIRLDLPPVYDKNTKFEIYIYDRALHRSNTVWSPTITRGE